MEKEFRYSQKITFREGDEMRISGGPYYQDHKGVRHCMGVKGIHYFSHVDDAGHVWAKNKRGVMSMVYMGDERLSEATGTYMRPHELTKLRKRKCKD